MFKQIDQSPFLIRLLKNLSDFLARQRGLPIVVGIIFIIGGFVVELINVGVGSPALEVTHIILHNVGLLSALIGFLLIEPLG